MMRRLLVVMAVTLLAACSSKAKLREPAELQDIVPVAVKPSSAWSSSTGGDGGHYSTLKLAQESDALFSADADGNVYAFNTSTGKQIWRARTKAPVISGPSVADDLVLVGTRDAQVIALKRSTGAEAWRAAVSSEVLAAPAGNSQMIVVRSVDGRIVGLSPANGSRQWTVDRSVPNLTLRGLSEPLLQSGKVWVGMDNGRVASLNALTGQVLWEQAIGSPSGRTELDRITDVDAALLADGPYLCAASFAGEIACVDSDSGEPQWRRSIKSYSGMDIAGNLIVITDEAGVVWALDARSGAAAWKQEGLQYRKLSAPIAFKDFIVVGDFEGYLHWLNPRDGKLVGRSYASWSDTPIRAPMVAGDDLLYVMNTDGKIVAVKP